MNRVLIFFGILFVVGCTKENFIDTGLAKGIHDCSMLEYMENDTLNWDSTVVLIRHAGLEKMFDGTDERYPQITFFGPTKLSVIRYLELNEKEKIADLDPAECKEMLLMYVVKDVLLKKDIPEGTSSRPWPPIPGEGGISVLAEGGGRIFRVYSVTEDYGEVIGGGPTYIYLEAQGPDGKTSIDVASANIQFTNGVIHSLHYTHTFGNL